MAVIHRTVPRHRLNAVDTYEIAGITSTNIGKIHKVPAGSTVKAVLVAAGTGSVYSTNDPRTLSDLDDTLAEIEASTNADWDEWTATDVTASTTSVTTAHAETVTLAPTSGTWKLQVSVPALR